jgi:acyl-CoA synthetase (AMP-forming)/AMP-acid ligase II
MRVPLTVNDFLRRAELVHPDRTAIVDDPDQPATSWGSITYAEMARRSRAMAAGLDALGIAPGERVAMVSHNSARLLTAFFGVSGSGRVLVPINFRLSAGEVEYIVGHSGARVLMVDADLMDELGSVDCEMRWVIGEESDSQLMRFDVEPVEWEADEDATATINYTSGTTARPKGVQLTHRNVWLNASIFGWHMGVDDRDVYLHTLPQFHCNGWGMLYAVTGMGGRHVIQRRIDGPEILRRVEREGVTLVCCAPAVLKTILDAAAHWDGPIPGSGRTRIVVAGAAPPTSLIERCETELGWEFVQIYGLTETTPVATLNRTRIEWDDLEVGERAALLGRAGVPVIGSTIRVDSEGEVRVRGNMVMEGYWQQPDVTATVIEEGFFRTGDGGRITEDNHLVITDRKKDVINSGAENVSSIEVEDAIFSHPEVAEVAVIGIPDDTWGEAVLALVVTVPGSTLDEAQVIAWVRDRLAHFKAPKRVEFREELARTATGKLQKFKLREPYWVGFERRVN